MNLKKSERKQVKLRLGISGASGFGKTKSALLLAYGMTLDWNKIAVIDTENSSASLYSDLGSFSVLELDQPFSPERYIQAIELCEKSGISVIIIDSVSHEWNGTGGCLDIHEKLGGRFQDWANVTPRHQSFINKILQSSCHVITTTRRKVDYSLDISSNGKTKVTKHGTKEITREGFEYELTVNFEIVNENHLAKASKDRTGIFMNKPEFVINSETGKLIIEWCNVGSDPAFEGSRTNSLPKINLEEAFDQPTLNSLKEVRATEKQVYEAIQLCRTIAELLALYKSYPNYQESLRVDYEARKSVLINSANPNNSRNGINKIQ